MKRFWISWYAHKVAFTWHGPWWESGYRVEQDGSATATICAAVVAESEDDAERQICAAHEGLIGGVELRFCNERRDDWEPFCDRFPRADWMQWPYPDRQGAPTIARSV